MVTLYLLGAQKEVFRAGTVIAAYTVIDGRNHVVSWANTEREAQAIVDQSDWDWVRTNVCSSGSVVISAPPSDECPDCGLSRDGGFGDFGCERCGT